MSAPESDNISKRAVSLLIREFGIEQTREFLEEVGHAKNPTALLENMVADVPLPTPTKALLDAPISTTATAFPTTPQLPEQLPLFTPDVQPWRAPPARELNIGKDEKRESLLAALADSKLATVEQRVLAMLQSHPETRDSDTALAVRYWRRFQADTLEQWKVTDLEFVHELESIDSITRARRRLQNTYGLFEGKPRTSQLRQQLQMEFHNYVAQQQQQDPEVRMFFDETGGPTSERFVGVAGLCVIDWRQWEIHYAALNQWRQIQNWPETIHFADLDAATQPRAVALLQQLQRRRSGTLFAGYAIPARGNIQSYLLSLFVQLTIDCLKHLQKNGCLRRLSAITFVKEADDGFDHLHKATLGNELSMQIARDFPNQAYLRDIQCIAKGREVMLEAADLIAASMQRRSLYGSRNPKDKLAEAVYNVTGFDDVKDQGAVFRSYITPQ